MAFPTVSWGAITKANGNATPALPSHSADDYLMLFVNSDGTGASNSLSGAEAVDYTPALIAVGSGSSVMGTYDKLATSSSHAAVTATVTSEEQAAWYGAISGASGAPVATTASDTGTTNATIDCPAGTGLSEDMLVIRMAHTASAGNTVTTPPAGTEVYNDVTNGTGGQAVRFIITVQNVAGGGSVPASTVEFSAANRMIAATIVVPGTTPAVGGGGEFPPIHQIIRQLIGGGR